MINVGILGAGNIAEKMARTIQATAAAKTYAVGSRSLKKAQAFAEKFDFDKAYGSYEALVQDPDLDLVYVATPHNFHYQHAKLALDHGKHVLCEKALTLNAKEAESLMALAHQKGLTFMEAIWPRYMPLNRQLKEMIDMGKIGQIQAIHASLAYPIKDKERMKRPDLAGGSLLDLGVYPIHFTLSLLGNDYDKVHSLITKTDQGVDLHTSILLSYPNGAQALIHSSMADGPYSHALVLGDKGRFEIDGTNHIETIRVYDLDNQLIGEYKRPNDFGGFEYQLEEAIRLIREGKVESTIVTHEDSLAVMRLCDTVRYDNQFYYPEEG
ncbi:TPA: Gfo/Idh/MocA family protein [Streptococcus suis]